LSGHGNNPTDRYALTYWRWQREVLVRTRKDTDRPTRTHILETVEGGTCQNTERNRPIDAHSPTGEERETLLRTRKETDRPTRTYRLETIEGGTCQDTERIRPPDAHSPTGDGRERDLSEHGKNPTDRRTLTSWRRQREALVRTWNKSDRPTRTHMLETAEEAIVRTRGKKQTNRRALTSWRR
jgi:hypothetical protein